MQTFRSNWRLSVLLSAFCLPSLSIFADDFPTPLNSEKSTTSPMAPGQVIDSAKLPPGFELSLFAAEPDVQNPIAMTTDERGRLWVAENYSWAGGGAGGFDGNQRDRIVVLEDSDGDGKHDKRVVFWDDARKLTSIEVGNGGIWALCLPNLLFFPDKNRDDVPDSPPVVILDGFDEGVVGHTPANGLKWGPDGWLYARHGIQATSNIGKPGSGDSQRIRINTGVWRYHPIHETVETVMHGMTNSWGFDFDEHGQMFVINTVIGHLWHVIPGSHVERMYGVDLNPNAYQLIAQTADHVHWDDGGEKWNTVQKGMSDKTNAAGGGHAHIGLMIYQGDNWPAEYRNRLFTLNLHGLRINSNLLERQGAGYVGKRAPDFCFIADPWFRGMEIITGPDGGVYVADWSDTGECHDHDGVHRTSGRIYKITFGKPKPIASVDLSAMTNSQLLALQSHPNAWWPRTARRILTERWNHQETKPDVASVRSEIDKALATATDTAVRLRWMETCYGIGAADQPWLLSHLSAENEHERVTALRFLVDRLNAGSSLSGPLKASLLQLAKSDRSGLVQLYLASALQRLPIADRWPIAMELASKAEFQLDRSLPSMLWYGVEAAVPVDPAKAISLAEVSVISRLTENIARRLTLEIDSKPEVVNSLLAAAERKTFPLPQQVLIGMSKALDGWQKATPPSNWMAFSKRFDNSDSKEIVGAMQALRLVFGDGRAVEEMAKLIDDGSADAEARRQAMRSLLKSRPADFGPVLVRLLGDRAVVREAIRGLAQYELTDAPKQLLDRVSSFGPAERTEMINTLSARPSYAKSLLAAVRNKVISPSEISAFHARQIRSFDDEWLTAELTEIWGDVRGTSEDKRKMIDQLRAEFSSEVIAKSDLRAGRALFQKSCATCHVMYGVGVKIGPDLTGSNRKNLDYLLENIVDPSASVGTDFRTMIVLLDDGRVINGVVSESTERTLTLQTATEAVTLDRAEIESMKQSKTSLMPDGLLQNQSAEQIRDLFGYLMSSEQVPLPD